MELGATNTASCRNLFVSTHVAAYTGIDGAGPRSGLRGCRALSVKSRWFGLICCYKHSGRLQKKEVSLELHYKSKCILNGDSLKTPTCLFALSDIFFDIIWTCRRLKSHLMWLHRKLRCACRSGMGSSPSAEGFCAFMHSSRGGFELPPILAYVTSVLLWLLSGLADLGE